MYTILEEPEEVKRLAQVCKGLVAGICAKLKPASGAECILAQSDLFESTNTANSFWVVREGVFSCFRDGKLVLFYEEGDLIGLERLIGYGAAKVTSEFAVIVDRYEMPELFEALARDKNLLEEWNRYLIHQMLLYASLWGAAIPGERPTSPEVRHFQAGDILIEQGGISSEVYTLLEGHADVLVDGVKVGEVLADEIFGAIGPLTGTPRTARVMATANCMVISLPKENFIELIKDRPATVKKLVEDMARSLVALNARVVGLSR